MVTGAWELTKDTVKGFIADEALSHGASIAYYTLFAVAPVLLIIIAIAGLVFGREAAEAAIVAQLSGLMGESTAKALEEILHKVGDREGGVWATVVGVGALILTATGVFGEVQSALNVIWKAKDDKAKQRRSTLGRLARARAASLGLVVTSGFLITVSLATSAALEALSGYLRGVFPGAETVLTLADFVISTALIGFLFAAIYKVLPDKPIAWRDVAIGALVTALLFEAGKYLIALYIGKSDVASTYGAAGALVVLLLWIYYTAQIFLLGAEFTYAYARRYGSLSRAGEGADLSEADRDALHELLEDAERNVALTNRRVEQERRSVEQLERQRQDSSGARRALATAERTLKMRAAHRDRLRHDLGVTGGAR
ncbi:MAG TPA: YihY/virulence factor BrkB family protein [Reyranella sp.]|jgi:membrane protein|nr:YihY/virulence factor BrkB family protein [Reyranella sp.]